jgi:hypothetical protein
MIPYFSVKQISEQVKTRRDNPLSRLFFGNTMDWSDIIINKNLLNKIHQELERWFKDEFENAGVVSSEQIDDYLVIAFTGIRDQWDQLISWDGPDYTLRVAIDETLKAWKTSFDDDYRHEWFEKISESRYRWKTDKGYLSELISVANTDYLNYMEENLEEDKEYAPEDIEGIALNWYNQFAEGLDNLYQETFGQTGIDPDKAEWIQNKFQAHIKAMMSYNHFVEESDNLWMNEFQDGDGNSYWKKS